MRRSNLAIGRRCKRGRINTHQANIKRCESNEPDRVIESDAFDDGGGEILHPSETKRAEMRSSATGAEFDVLRIDVMPEPVSHMESLAIYFPAVLRDEATLRMHWGTLAVPLKIKAPFKPAD